MNNQLFFSNKINTSYSSSQISHNVTTEEINNKSIKYIIDAIPQNFLLICILILFILFLILIIIILIYLIKKRKKLLQTETIVNNNIDINKMILQNSKNNLKDFQQLKNNSNVNDCSIGVNNISLTELKTKNLKEEIHSIVCETLSEMSLNKAKKYRKNRKPNIKRKSGQLSVKIDNNNDDNTNKGLKLENKS